MSITYTVCDHDAEPMSYDWYGEELTAKTDLGARRQAKKRAQENGWKRYTITFFRSEDGCRGWIDV